MPFTTRRSSLVVALLLTSSSLILSGCGGGSSSTGGSQNPPATPTLQFSAGANSVTMGSSTTLTWSATNATGVTIDNGIGAEPATGSVSITPSATTTYTATASNGSQSVQQKVTVTVTASSKTVKSVAVTPATSYVRVSATVQLTATATYSDGTTGDVTSQLAWSSADSSIAGVSSSGVINAAAPGATDITGTIQGVSSSAHVAVNAAAVASVLTYHNDAFRDGTITNETTLTTSNVNSNQFGKRLSYAVDGQIYAQPLYMSGLKVNGGTHNVVFVATENDSVYAFDADGGSSSALWKVNFGTAASSGDVEGISPKLGITSTPVIDASTGTMYVVSDTVESGKRVFRLHALDVTSGAEKLGGPVIITGSVSGTGYGSSGGVVTMQSSCYQRSGLALNANNVYVSFGHCSHGWMFAFDKTSLQQTALLNTTPDGGGGAFWNGGGAPAIDNSGNLYMISATDQNDPGSGYNDSFLQLSATLSITDFFMPSNDAFLRANDADLGSGDNVIMPDNVSSTPHEVIGGGKDGRIFVVNRDNMGKFVSGGPDQVIQMVQTGTQQFDNMFDTPAYWNGNLYVHCENDVLKAYSWSSTTGKLSTTYTSKGSAKFGVHGATVSVSSGGGSDAIVWEVESTAASSGGAAILRASDANDVSNELYDSSQASGSRDQAGLAVKFVVPTVADGLVFVGTGNELDIYGLL